MNINKKSLEGKILGGLPGSYAYVHKSADPMTTAAFSQLLSKSILYMKELAN